jgi:hypothetical protein
MDDFWDKTSTDVKRKTFPPGLLFMRPGSYGGFGNFAGQVASKRCIMGEKKRPDRSSPGKTH